MAQQTINVGAAPNDGTGDPLQTAFTKCNDNFTELYAAGSGGAATPPQGRLTLQSATPVMTTTQSAKTTIFYTPYVGNKIPIYDGTDMVMTTFAELSVATTDTTKSPAAIGASKVHDWFVWSDAGTVRVGHGPDWSDDTTRSAGTALVRVNGIWLNNVSITNGPAAQRGTYVGTTRSNASSQLDWIYGSVAAGTAARGSLGVWNAYNRVDVGTLAGDTTASWTVTSAASWAQGAAGLRISFVSGLEEDAFEAIYSAVCISSTSSLYSSIGYDSVTSRGASVSSFHPASTTSVASNGKLKAIPLGFHFVAAIEINSGAAVTGTFYGTSGAPSLFQTSLSFSLRM